MSEDAISFRDHERHCEIKIVRFGDMIATGKLRPQWRRWWHALPPFRWLVKKVVVIDLMSVGTVVETWDAS